MSSTKSPKAAKSSKEARHDIEKKLDLLLIDLKKELGDNKFKSRVKKAAKLLSKGIGKAKKTAVASKAVKPKAKTAREKTKKTPATPATVAAE